jgi:hypothetical protein
MFARDMVDDGVGHNVYVCQEQPVCVRFKKRASPLRSAFSPLPEEDPEEA